MRNEPSQNFRSSKRWKPSATQHMLERNDAPSRHTSNPNPNHNPNLNTGLPHPPLGYLPPPANFPLGMLPVPPGPIPAFPFHPIPPPLPFPPLPGTNNLPFAPPLLQPLVPGAPEQWSGNYNPGTANVAPSSPTTMDRHSRRTPQMHDHSFNGNAHRSAMNSQAASRAFHAGSNYTGDLRGTRTASHNANGGSSRSRVQSLTNPVSRRIGSMLPIRDALAGYSDESNLIARFAQFISDNGRTVPPNQRRMLIHDFSGFSPDRRPAVEVLTMLNKPDLDSLAWALGLPRGGRKFEVASRISLAMRAPLQWRMPTSRRNTANRTVSSAHASSSAPGFAVANYSGMPSNQMSAPAPSTHQGPPPVMDPNTNRGSMPSMPRQATYSGASRQRAPSILPRKKGKDMMSILRDQKFVFAENPFNIPLGPPLGNIPHVLFTSAQLSNGIAEPRITFQTPDLSVFDKDAGDVLVHLRCLKVEMGKPVHLWKQSWPFPASARVNTSNVELNQAQRFTNGKLAGMDKATNITPFLRARRANAPDNIVIVRRSANSTALASGNFVLFAQPVLVRNMAAMLTIVKNCSAKFWLDYRRTQVSKGMDPNASDFEMARRQVVDLMTGSDDFAMTSQKISLKCPLSLVPISIPSKGKKCTHVQCFDLNSYLEYTRRSTKFNCPVCNAHESSPSSLIISPFFEHALKKFHGCDEVEIYADGSIKAVQANRKGIPSADSDSEDDAKTSSRNRKSSSTANGTSQVHMMSNAQGGVANKKSAKVVTVVDLTLDSDEEDTLPPIRNSNVSQSGPKEDANNKSNSRDNGSLKNAKNDSGENSCSGDGDFDMTRGDQSVADFTFEATFQAADQFLPWENPDDHTSTDNGSHMGTPRETTPSQNVATSSYQRMNNSNVNSNQDGWTNSIDVITIDSD